MKDVSTIEHAISHAIPKALGLIVYLFFNCNNAIDF